jgi:hypothetical protein
VKKLLGTKEFIQGSERWCLWIEDENLSLANQIPEIADRIEKVRKFRNDSEAKTTNGYAKTAHKFAQRCHKDSDAIINPATK